jgi:hypothetical protein
MSDITCELQQFFTLTVQATSGKGSSVPFVDIPQWVSSDLTVVKIKPSQDGLSAMVTPEGVGIADITVTADGLSGDWNVEIVPARIIFQSSAPSA